MARFLCTYLDQSEKKRRSFVEAFHQQEARELLVAQGAQILDIRKARERTVQPLTFADCGRILRLAFGWGSENKQL